MVESLRLHNFQSYRHAKFDFSKGVNVIVGSTDAGKSRIVKALKWVTRNKPRVIKVSPKNDPDAITTVTLKVDGYVIKRRKSKKLNEYILITREKKKRIFKAFKAGVPEEIKEVLNMSSLNFQNQHDAPFLLSISPGARARYLNKSINLEVIDRSQKNITSRVNKEYSLLKKERDKAKEVKKKLKKFDWLVEAEDQLRKIEIENRKISSIERELDTLLETSSKLKDNRKKIRKLKKITKFEKEVRELVAMAEEINREEEVLEELKELSNNINFARKEKKKWEGNFRTLQDKYNRLMEGTCPLCGRSK